MEVIMKKRLLSILLGMAALAPLQGFAAAKGAALPKGYEKWEKSRQKIINEKKSLFGIHYIYAEKKAMKTYKTGGSYPEGSAFVVVHYGIKEERGKPVEGKKKMVVLMKKDKRFKETGGWLFAGFTGEGAPSRIDLVTNCYECHLQTAKDTDLVISKYPDFK
jgi:hypothetical protein